jgi:uncharacterized protein (UPF0333 family)
MNTHRAEQSHGQANVEFYLLMGVILIAIIFAGYPIVGPVVLEMHEKLETLLKTLGG